MKQKDLETLLKTKLEDKGVSKDWIKDKLIIDMVDLNEED